MTTREKKLAVVTGVVGLAAAVVGGYLFVLQPLADADAQEVELRADIQTREDALLRIDKDRGRLGDMLKRSLPADVDAAAREYEAVLSKLLNDADVKANTRTLKLRSVELKGPPLNPTEDAKKHVPAYTAVGLDVTLKRVKYATLIDVLYRYYQLNLLHQISRFTVKRVDDSGARRSGTGSADIADLEVSFTSTAISLNGAEGRRALLPASPLAAAAAGGLGYAGLRQSPEVARNQAPLQFAPVLATIGRNYSKLLVADIFHGPPPPPPAVPPPPPEEVKEDTSAFIRLTGLGRNSDGTGSALIEDAASKNEYAVELTRKDGKLVPLVSKFYHSAAGKKRRMDDPDSTLDISEASSGTARLFRVVGLDDGGLVLVSREAKAEPERRRPGGSNRFKDAPAAAAAGVAPVAAPPEAVFVWKTGDPLSKLKPLSAADGRQAVLRATGGEPNDTVTTSAELADEGR